MTLYEPLSLLWVLITVFVVGIWGGGMTMLDRKIARDCEQQNHWLLEEQRQGPLRLCERRLL